MCKQSPRQYAYKHTTAIPFKTMTYKHMDIGMVVQYYIPAWNGSTLSLISSEAYFPAKIP